jgi:hypothetical protein
MRDVICGTIDVNSSTMTALQAVASGASRWLRLERHNGNRQQRAERGGGPFGDAGLWQAFVLFLVLPCSLTPAAAAAAGAAVVQAHLPLSRIP